LQVSFSHYFLTLLVDLPRETLYNRGVANDE